MRISMRSDFMTTKHGFAHEVGKTFPNPPEEKTRAARVVLGKKVEYPMEIGFHTRW